MNWPQPFSSTGELRNFNQTTVMNDVSCDSVGGKVLTSRSQSFSSLPSYQAPESMHNMTPMLEFSGSGNANTMQGVVSNHGLDSTGGDIPKHVGAAIQRLDAHLNQDLKREDAYNYAVPPDILGIKRPHELAVSDEVQKEVRSDSKKRKVGKKQEDVIVVDKKQLEEISAEISYVNSVDLAKSSFNLKKHGGIPRPRNAFLIFSNWVRERFQFSGGTDVGELYQSDLCKFFGVIWKKLDDDRKSVFMAAAEFEKNEHKNSFSDYKYHPRRRGAAIYESTSLTPASKSIEPLKITVVKKQAGIPSAAVGKGDATTRTASVNEESIQLINSPSWGRLAELCCIEDGLTSSCKERILEAAINQLETFEALAESFKNTDTQ